ncbi:DUF2470 domain-containing protein [Streptomyces sp. TP-A0874]|uniref:DUF2470 domain-containing protein n=1 Tax=Streptomyces sp. TP-A0874 TaxID=549819 RepID=UPI000D1C1A2B|nr:DUF2470 domain-containing protein [Streptomyces sp. TP-A0874]
MDDNQRPTAAERVRTLAVSNASATLGIPGFGADELGSGTPAARTVSPDGDVLLLMPAGCPAARAAPHAQDDDLAAVVEITDVAPVAVPHRIRGRGWIAGWLTAVPEEERALCAELLAEQHPMSVAGILGSDAPPPPGPNWYPPAAWALLRLEVAEAGVDDLWGEAVVDADDFAAATADPLTRHEADLLQHLAAAHGEQLRSLCGLVTQYGGEFCAARARVVPVALDRFGLRVRFTESDTRCFDARFDFPEPVRDVIELRDAMHLLFQAATETG